MRAVGSLPVARRGLGLAALACAMPAAAADPSTLWARLRAGGLVLVMRHAQTDPGVGDPPEFRLGECATQRNLDQRGRDQAVAWGVALRREGVSIDRLLSSRWCRCLDTAALIGVAAVEPFPALDSTFGVPRAEASGRESAVRRAASGWVGPGNLLLVTHQVNASALTGRWTNPGEAVVTDARLEPLGSLMPPQLG